MGVLPQPQPRLDQYYASQVPNSVGGPDQQLLDLMYNFLDTGGIGPTGPAGLTGSSGPTGTTGPTGAQGQGSSGGDPSFVFFMS